MITADLKFKNNFKFLTKKAKDESIKRLFRVGGLVKKIAARSIKTRSRKKKELIMTKSGQMKFVERYIPSKPGSPPFTHGPKKALKKSIAFKVDKGLKTVAVGPKGSDTDGFARFHEFGGKRGKSNFPKRPFMGPALKNSLPYIPKQFQNII